MPVCKNCLKEINCGSCRGLCNACYVKFSRLVRLGATTWASLEAGGRVNKARQKGRQPKSSDGSPSTKQKSKRKDLGDWIPGQRPRFSG